MKSAGKRSSSFPGSINIFANGVAVIPKYVVLLKRLSNLLIQSLIAAGWESSSFVFTEALSASSSISISGRFICPCAFWVLLSDNHLIKLLRILLFFLITKITGQLTFSIPKLLFLSMPLSKSLVTDVNATIFLSVPYLPTPTG